jgi:hypothetical protein
MTYTNRRGRRWVANWTLLIAIFAFSGACSSDKAESLLLVNVPLGALPPTASAMSFTVLVDGQQVAQEVHGVAENAEGKYGIYLPSSASGSATVSVVVADASGCVLATGAGGPVSISAGEKSAPVVVTFTLATTPCGTPDGGLPDTSVPSGIDGGPVDVVTGETSTSIDGGPSGSDGAPLDADAGRDDVPPSDARNDVVGDVAIAVDRPADLPTTDVALPGEVGGDIDAVDATPDTPPSTMSVFRNCTEYTHTVTFSDGTIGNWAVLKVIFTPDGKNLVSLGEDGRAKVWSVTPTGLVPDARGLIFTGNFELTGALRSDGKYLAIGEREGTVTIYDLPASIANGAGVQYEVLPPTDLSVVPWRALPRHFTSDGNHLVVAYSADSSPDPNLVVVWDVTSKQIVRSVPFDYDEWPMAALPGDYLDPMWIASAVENYGAGGYETIVSIVDIAQASPVKTQVTIPGTVDAMAFTPDGSGLAVGMDSGEVNLWDISDKTKLVPPSAPLVPEVSGLYTDVYALSFTSDGSYLGVAGESSSDSAVKLVSLAQKSLIQKTIKYRPISLAFAPGNLALAVGEYNLGVVMYCSP